MNWPWTRRAPRPTLTDDEIALAHEAIAKLSTAELRAIGQVRWSMVFWPGLIAHCYLLERERPPNLRVVP